MDAITSGLRSEALCKRLAATEAQLEQLRATSRVIDLKAIMAAIPAAIDRYRTLVVRKIPAGWPEMAGRLGCGMIGRC